MEYFESNPSSVRISPGENTKKSYKAILFAFVLIVVYTAVFGVVLIKVLNVNKRIQTSNNENKEIISRNKERIRTLEQSVKSLRAVLFPKATEEPTRKGNSTARNIGHSRGHRLRRYINGRVLSKNSVQNREQRTEN